MKTIEGYNVKTFTDNIEENALEQIRELLSIEVFADRKIRIMPDVHAGAGCVIGFTGDLGDKVIPNIVGVDIGCGMRVLNLGAKGRAVHYSSEYARRFAALHGSRQCRLKLLGAARSGACFEPHAGLRADFDGGFRAGDDGHLLGERQRFHARRIADGLQTRVGDCRQHRRHGCDRIRYPSGI